MSFQRVACAVTFFIGVGTVPWIARADVVDLAWDSAGRMQRELAIAPGKFIEICGKLRAVDAIDWQFEAAAPLDFNIHFHEGDKVEYPEKQEARLALAGTFKPAKEQDYCWMWKNRGGNPVTTLIRMQRQGAY